MTIEDLKEEILVALIDDVSMCRYPLLQEALEAVRHPTDIKILCGSGIIEVCVNVLTNRNQLERKWRKTNHSQIIFAIKILNWGLSHRAESIIQIFNDHWPAHLLYTQVNFLASFLSFNHEENQHVRTLYGYLLFYTPGLFTALR